MKSFSYESSLHSRYDDLLLEVARKMAARRTQGLISLLRYSRETKSPRDALKDVAIHS